MYCNSLEQAQDCVQGMPSSPTNIQGLVYGLWEFSHSASLEGCFAIQMSDRRETAERKWKNSSEDRGINMTVSLNVIQKSTLCTNIYLSTVCWHCCPHTSGLEGIFYCLGFCLQLIVRQQSPLTSDTWDPTLITDQHQFRLCVFVAECEEIPATRFQNLPGKVETNVFRW